MKKTLSLVLVLTMMLSLFSFTTASAEAPRRDQHPRPDLDSLRRRTA